MTAHLLLPLLQAAPLATRAGVPTSPAEMIASATPVTKAVLVVLLVLSFVSWAIMLAKWREFRSVTTASHAFVHDFEHAGSLDQAAALARGASPNPFSRVFGRATQFLAETRPALAATPDRVARLSGSQVEALRLVLDSDTSAERDALGRFLPWLATIGSVSPLIGLLGTVLGVIEAFIGIATQGSGNIGAVAPGVAEALIATAAALAVAIPAVFGYNLFASRLNRIDRELEGFGSEVIALMVREERI
ncbi:MAG TPA: MotA/TolQ/ExbB proton channel family protein [Gemmatimonadaceae bacterium]|nr:MotA/TolQ/ExbB proton channel family protein [Gemmatimonadaceae bacterium]